MTGSIQRLLRGERNYVCKAWLKSKYCLDVSVIEVDDYLAAQANSCVWGTAGVVCNGEAVNCVRVMLAADSIADLTQEFFVGAAPSLAVP